MPEEKTTETRVPGDKGSAQGGDTPEAAPSAAAQEPAEPEESIAFRLVDTTDPQDSKGDDDKKPAATVPSSRLREESERRRQAEQRAQALESQMQRLIETQQQMMMQQQARANGTADPDADLRARFGDDDDGKAAYEAVKNVSEATTRAQLEKLREEIRAEAQGLVNQKVGAIQASLSLSQKLEGMKTNGLLDNGAAREVASRAGQFLAQNPGWQQHQDLLIDKVYMDMLRNGEIKPQRTAPGMPGNTGNTPWSAGAGTGAKVNAKALQDRQDEEIREIQRMNPRRFGRMTLEEMRELMGPPAQPQQQVAVPVEGAPNVMMDGGVASAAYVHQRPERRR